MHISVSVGSIIWLLSMAAATNVLDQSNNWLVSSYRHNTRELPTMLVV